MLYDKSRVTGSSSGFDIDVKRFYMEGVKIIKYCPECNEENVMDLSDEHLSYPAANKPFAVEMCCNECGYEYEIPMLMSVDLTIIEDC